MLQAGEDLQNLSRFNKICGGLKPSRLFDKRDCVPGEKPLFAGLTGEVLGYEETALTNPADLKELRLFKSDKCIELLKSEDFIVRKRGLRIATYHKHFYSEEDEDSFQTISSYLV